MTNQPIVPAKMQALLFDAYGTLFDVHSIVRSIGHGITGHLEELSQLWRQKQLETTLLRALMERYEDFWSVTEAALRWAVKELSIEITDPQINMLMQAYLAPSTFADVSTALEAFDGIPLAILSNGSPMMLDSAVRSNGLESNFTEIISVDPRSFAFLSERFSLFPRTLGTLPEQRRSATKFVCAIARGKKSMTGVFLLISWYRDFTRSRNVFRVWHCKLSPSVPPACVRYRALSVVTPAATDSLSRIGHRALARFLLQGG